MFARTFDMGDLRRAGLATDMDQVSVSFNGGRTLRGMHYQADPHGEEKLVAASAVRSTT